MNKPKPVKRKSWGEWSQELYKQEPLRYFGSNSEVMTKAQFLESTRGQTFTIEPEIKKESKPKAEIAGQKINEVSEGMPMQTRHPSNTSSLRHSSAKKEDDWLSVLEKKWTVERWKIDGDLTTPDWNQMFSEIRNGHEKELERVRRECK